MRGIYLLVLAGLLFFAGCVGTQTTQTTTAPSPAPAPAEQQEEPTTPTAPAVEGTPTVQMAIDQGETVECKVNVTVLADGQRVDIEETYYLAKGKIALVLEKMEGGTIPPNVTLPTTVLVSKEENGNYTIYLKVNAQINDRYCEWIKIVSDQPPQVEYVNFDALIGDVQTVQESADNVEVTGQVVCEIYQGTEDPFVVEGTVCESLQP
ncbi:MAG: hypothetical protein GXN92_01900 [Candidatus Micrarchaeota archaeon]|nr:hypothetical protein [Candidatus Micrarchaeota archaeon]